MVFTMTQSGPEGGDCTAPYKIHLADGATVGEVVVQILENRSDWGIIQVHALDGNQKPRRADYKHGSIDNAEIAKVMPLPVKKASASGGWSRMDYILWV